MPSRHISPHSFDEILSDLGEDPAIPDPHGIRKPNSPKKTPWDDLAAQNGQSKSEPNPSISKTIQALGDFKKVGILIALAAGIVVGGTALFFTHEAMKSDQELAFQDTKGQISQLKNELALLREEIIEMEDSLYESIDILEVSVHSLTDNKAQSKPKPESQRLPFEQEVRQWRYLGNSQIGPSQRAFFHNGKSSVMIEKGAPLLGDWMLSNVNKEGATITHLKGKSFMLKASKTE